MTSQINTRRDWFGDMEPEYEEIVDWMCCDDEAFISQKLDAMPLSWVAMISHAMGTQSTRRIGY
ncbi:MAG: hypothetical protein HQL93_10740 [Magnetococcales bacterium]|nr:hypothetical protein [Magnetococcales bacterium]